MVFRAKFSVAEIWSMYESLRHAPALFWEEYKNLPDVEVNESNNHRFRERVAPYSHIRTNTYNKIMAVAAVLTVALTMFLSLAAVWGTLLRFW